MATLKSRLSGPVSRVILLPGNGCTPVLRCNFYKSVRDELAAWLRQPAVLQALGGGEGGIPVMLQDMPDPYKARETIWLPFIRKELGADANAIVIGHSSGAEALMRLLETDRLRGAVVVSPCHTDLGMASEAVSGYYARPWRWDDIRANATDFLMQMSGPDDELVPYHEQKFVHEQLHTELHLFPGSGHFLIDEFPQLVELIKAKLVVAADAAEDSGSASAPATADTAAADGAADNS